MSRLTKEATVSLERFGVDHGELLTEQVCCNPWKGRDRSKTKNGSKVPSQLVKILLTASA